MIPWKMNGPNPAKISNYISGLLDDSDFMPKSSILALLQHGKVQANPYKMASQTGCGPFKINRCYSIPARDPKQCGGGVKRS